jgi:hypothetical protein
MRNTNSVGNVTDGLVMAALLRAGYRVFLPFGACDEIDLVVERDGTLRKVQCKTGRLRQGAIQFNLYTVASDLERKRPVSRSYGRATDFYGVYCPDNGKVYLVPSEDMPTKWGTLRVLPTANGQQKRVRWADAYEL